MISIRQLDLYITPPFHVVEVTLSSYTTWYNVLSIKETSPSQEMVPAGLAMKDHI
jgi:hypothetical protein